MAIVYTNFFGGAFFGGGFFGNLPTTTQQGGGGYNPSQGNLHPYGGHEVRTRTREEISKAREAFGLIDRHALQVIESVALRQAQSLEVDEQKRFDELKNSLDLEKIQWNTRYLELMNLQREAFIEAEIASRLSAKLALDERNQLMLLALAASV